jgi:Tol biopolymer transport system component
MLPGSFVKGPEEFNCVGLTETAYEYAGIDLVSEEQEKWVITPAEQYRATKPAVGNNSKIPFVSFTGSGSSRSNSQIEIMNEDGSNIQQITYDSSKKNYPRLSLDRTKIIFESIVPDSYGDDISTLYTMNLNGSELTELVGSAESIQPAWSSKNQIAFIPEYGSTIIATFDLSNPSVRKKLTNSSVVEVTPSFSPDGNYVIFHFNRHDVVQWNIISKTMTTFLSGTGTTKVYREPEFSSDGNKIVLSTNLYADNNFDISLYDVNSKNLERLTSSPSKEYSPHFSKDGTKIFFASDNDGTYQIYSINSDGSGQRQLTFGSENHDFGYYN